MECPLWFDYHFGGEWSDSQLGFSLMLDVEPRESWTNQLVFSIGNYRGQQHHEVGKL